MVIKGFNAVTFATDCSQFNISAPLQMFTKPLPWFVVAIFFVDDFIFVIKFLTMATAHKQLRAQRCLRVHNIAQTWREPKSRKRNEKPWKNFFIADYRNSQNFYARNADFHSH